MEVIWTLYGPATADHLGAIPYIILPPPLDDQRVADQINARYAHGGGWSPYGQGRWRRNPSTGQLYYPGDTPLPVRASIMIGEELVTVHDYGLVCVVQPDGTFEVTRMD